MTRPADAGSGAVTIVSVSLHSTNPGQAASTHTVELRAAFHALGARGSLIARPADRGPARGLVQVLKALHAEIDGADVVYVRSHPLALAVIAMGRPRRVPVVLEVNGTIEDLFWSHPWTRRLAPLLRRVETVSLRLADGVVAVSTPLAEWARSRAGPRTPVTVVPNGADLGRFRPDAPPHHSLPRPYVAFCGALAPWQGINVLLAATREPAWPDGVDLVVAGDGGERGAIARAAEDNDRVRYLGVLPFEQVPSVVANALAVASTNTRDRLAGSPMKLYEAIACATPVVASDVEGQAEIVRGHGTGLVYAPTDPGALAAAVRRLAEDRELRERCRNAAMELRHEVSWTARARDLLRFLTGTVGVR